MLLGQILGSIGAVLLLSIPLTFLIAGASTFLIYIKLFFGVVFIATYFVTNREHVRNMAGNRSNALLAISALTMVVFFGVLAAVNFIGFKNPKEYDMTREGVYTLADQTVKTLKDLKEEVTVYAFYRSQEPQFNQAKDTLTRFASYSPNFKVEFVDPDQKPDLVEKYQVREGQRVVFTAKGQNEARPKDLTEQELTNALVKVTSSNQKKVYFLTGHGEPTIDEADEDGLKDIADGLRSEGYAVDQFSFAAQGGDVAGQKVDLNSAGSASTIAPVPADAKVIIAVAGKTPLSSGEADSLSKWAERGGRVLIGLEPKRESGLERVATAWHIVPRNDLVVDVNPVNRMMGMGPAMPLVQTYESHPITANFRQPIAFPTTRSLDVKDSGGIAGVTAKALAKTGKSSWGETDLSSGSAEFDEGKDTRGPVTLAAVATKSATASDKVSDEGRVVVFGDSQFENNKFHSFQANDDFFINTVNWLSGEEGKISIRPKQRGASRIFLTENEAAVIKFFSIDLLPVAIIALGVSIRQVRRRK
jgi:ABC-type uncharacterized transport system involved in gliding motility auxiliary subunit